MPASVRAPGCLASALLPLPLWGLPAALLPKAISRGIVKGGVAVQTVNLELEALEDVKAAISECDGFAIGSPTLGGHMPTQVRQGVRRLRRRQPHPGRPHGPARPAVRQVRLRAVPIPPLQAAVYFLQPTPSSSFC